MRLLDLIRELNANMIYPTLNDLLQQYCNSKAFLQLNMTELMQKLYLDQIEMPVDTGEFNKTVYKISEKGTHALERYRSHVRHIVSRLEELYEKGDTDELYRTLEDNRDLLRFAYYKGFITKAQLEKMAKKLEINVERIWWGDGQGETGA